MALNEIPVTSECDPIQEPPIAMVGRSNTDFYELQPGAELFTDGGVSGPSGTVPLASRKEKYVEMFETEELEACNKDFESQENGETFALQNRILQLDLKALELVTANFRIMSITDPGLETFSNFGGPGNSLTRTSDGTLWAVYLRGGATQGVLLAKSVDAGGNSEEIGQISTIFGDVDGPSICSDQNDLLHIVWRQNEIPVAVLHSKNTNVEVHYNTYPLGIQN